MGKVFFDDLKKYCRTDAGYAELTSVITKEKFDRTETYFYAETMKYLYLLFAPPETVNLFQVVFNTEAHPIKRTWQP
jgi:mannosidase alpha-like ER degradation enhancer 2